MAIASDEKGRGSDREATAEEAEGVVTEWRNSKLSMQDRSISDWDEFALFWGSTARTFFRVICVIARSILGAPSSTAVLRGSFGDAGRLVSSKRSLVGHAYVEVLMFHRGNIYNISFKIPRLSADKWEAAIPGRLRDRRTCAFRRGKRPRSWLAQIFLSQSMGGKRSTTHGSVKMSGTM